MCGKYKHTAGNVIKLIVTNFMMGYDWTQTHFWVHPDMEAWSSCAAVWLFQASHCEPWALYSMRVVSSEELRCSLEVPQKYLCITPLKICAEPVLVPSSSWTPSIYSSRWSWHEIRHRRIKRDNQAPTHVSLVQWPVEGKKKRKKKSVCLIIVQPWAGSGPLYKLKSNIFHLFSFYFIYF